MREIKFRGKRKDNGQWVYGCLVNNVYKDAKTGNAIPYITNAESCNSCLVECDSSEGFFSCDEFIPEVITETVGQYTGLKECPFGEEIYEGDILEVALGNGRKAIKKVIFESAMFKVEGENGIKASLCSINGDWRAKVIGNIYENPEL